MLASDDISWFYVIFGIFASGLVAAASYHLKLIKKDSELLYLSFGFYKHFSRIFFSNFFSSIKLIIKLALANKHWSHPLLYKINFAEENKFNPALLMASINLVSGLFSVGFVDNKILVHALDEEHFAKLNLREICNSLNQVNDDVLV
jgi:multisubunit Na+/H+ antiporter MnhE subunit